MKNWKKGMIAGSIICIATGFLFIGIGSSMGGWKNIDKINSRYIHFGGSDTFIGLNFPANTKESIQILSRGTDGPVDVGSTSTGEVISFNGKLPEEMEISANTLALKIVPGKSDAIILSGSNRDKMNCYIEDNCLYLEEKNHKPIQKGGEIVLTVPESMDWKKIEIDAQAAYVALQDFSAEEMEFSAGAGSIEASGLQTKKLILSAEAGGAITVTDSEAAELEADAEAGVLRFSGSITDMVDADAELGNIVLNLSQSEDDFDYEIDSDLGNVEFDGVSMENFVICNKASGKMKLDSSMGNIEIYFEQD